jgi:glutamine amidotransferase
MGWIEPLEEFIASGGYFFGICLGFQLLFSSSDEFGFHKGLNIIPGHVKKFNYSGLKVPHMGWNDVELKGKSKFLEGLDLLLYLRIQLQ